MVSLESVKVESSQCSLVDLVKEYESDRRLTVTCRQLDDLEKRINTQAHDINWFFLDQVSY